MSLYLIRKHKWPNVNFNIWLIIGVCTIYEMKDVEDDGQTETKTVQMSGTNADDHIIYTNAKIDAKVFD